MEKKKRWGNAALCLAFAVLCAALPLAGVIAWLCGWRQVEEENRTLARFPVVRTLEDLAYFPADFESWYSDHLFLKPVFVRWKSEAEAAIFKELDSEKVILGTKKPWLFHCSNDGQSLETYKRTNRFSKEELADIAENVDTLRQELEEAGIRFVLMISPDKEQIYGADYMPSHIRVEDGPTRTEQLIDYLAEEAPELCVVYPAEALRANRDSWQGADSLYYESDTHWNQAGAYIGTQELMKAIAGQMGMEWQPAEKTFEPSGTKRGDLQKMVKLGDSYDSQEYQAFPVGESAVLSSAADKNGEIIREKRESRAKNCLPVSVYVTADSFRWNLSRFLQEAAARTVITSRYYFDTEDLVMEEPDVFVYMIAERYLHELTMLPGYNTAALPMP